MPHIPENTADLEDRREPSTRLSDDPRPIVFDTLGKLRTLTASATITSLDEAIEKLLQSVERLRSLEESLRSIASLKQRLMNIEIQTMFETTKQAVKDAPIGNLIAFPAPTKCRDAGQIPEADSFRLQKEKSLVVHNRAVTDAAAEMAKSDPPTIFDASSVSGDPAELSATKLASTGQTNPAVVPATNAPMEQNAATPPKRALVDTEIRELVRTYGQMDKYATVRERATLRKASLAGSAALVFLAASCFFLWSRQPRQTAAYVDRPQEFAALAAREPVSLPQSTKSNQPEAWGNFSHAIAPAAVLESSSSQDHPLNVIVVPKPIESPAVKLSGNPSRIVPVAQESTEAQDRPDKINP